MRKQYHFRKVGEDTYIWDMDQLIHQSSHLPVLQISLDDIQELKEPYWFPNHYPNTIELLEHFKLVGEADLSYPIILCPEGRVMDGMHRVAKAKMLNLSFIGAVQFTIMPQPDFINVDEDDLSYD
ncbi:hypothetical protein AMD27_02755 [Acinetobacter sp. TGL-Y2]|uniref:hypothetical protein n=1 Tax=Acinetobacter sp. TGL-Y2 TaxID=1407071 RepID=UPI0007A6609D|nr:hypothetical protein [Acinetobacter sp. TGL-Y2]AMW77922.1 hypothetical protein AMD27_02755 [Acinetobacter sp. TGL-Y2]